jgi:hypothetical protein
MKECQFDRSAEQSRAEQRRACNMKTGYAFKYKHKNKVLRKASQERRRKGTRKESLLGSSQENQ